MENKSTRLYSGTVGVIYDAPHRGISRQYLLGSFPLMAMPISDAWGCSRVGSCSGTHSIYLMKRHILSIREDMPARKSSGPAPSNTNGSPSTLVGDLSSSSNSHKRPIVDSDDDQKTAPILE